MIQVDDLRRLGEGDPEEGGRRPFRETYDGSIVEAYSRRTYGRQSGGSSDI